MPQCDDLQGERRGYCIKELALASGDLDLCDAIEEYSPRKGCYWDIAARTGADFPCERLSEHDRAECRIAVAVARKDISYCEGIEDRYERSSCYFNMAMSSGNYTLCDGVEYTGGIEREDCLAHVIRRYGTAPLHLCDEMKDSFNRHECFSSLLPEVTDAGTCMTIKDDDRRRECIEYLAVLDMNVSLCREPYLKGGYDGCLFNMFFMVMDESFCRDHLPASFLPRCLQDLAIFHNDSSYCQKVPPSDGNVGECYRRYGEAFKDAGACMNVTHAWARQECLERTGLHARSVEECGQRIAHMGREWCIVDLAVMSRDESICDKLPDYSDFPLRCRLEARYAKGIYDYDDIITDQDQLLWVHNLAMDHNDARVCEGIDDKRRRENCLVYLIPGNRPMCGGSYQGVFDVQYACVSGSLEDTYAEYLKNDIQEYCSTFEYEKDRCVTRMQFVRGMADACRVENPADGRLYVDSSCIMELAKFKLAPQYCIEIQSESGRRECFMETLLIVAQPVECESIEEGRWRDRCYQFTAMRFKKPELCGIISGEGLKANCVAFYDEFIRGAGTHQEGGQVEPAADAQGRGPS